MLAIVSTMNPCTRMAVVPEYTMYGQHREHHDDDQCARRGPGHVPA